MGIFDDYFDKPSKLRSTVLTQMYDERKVARSTLEELYPEVLPLIAYNYDHEYEDWELAVASSSIRIMEYSDKYECEIFLAEEGTFSAHFYYIDNTPAAIRTPLWYLSEIPNEIKNLGDMAVDYWIYNQYATTTVTTESRYNGTEFGAYMSNNLSDFLMGYFPTKQEAENKGWEFIKIFHSLLSKYYSKKWGIKFDFDRFLLPDKEFKFSPKSEILNNKLWPVFFSCGTEASDMITASPDGKFYNDLKLYEGKFKGYKFVQFRQDGPRYFLGKVLKRNEEWFNEVLSRVRVAHIAAAND